MPVYREIYLEKDESVSVQPTLEDLLREEIGVADAGQANAAQHLAADDFNVFVVDGYRLGAIDLLDFVDQATLHYLASA